MRCTFSRLASDKHDASGRSSDNNPASTPQIEDGSRDDWRGKTNVPQPLSEGKPSHKSLISREHFESLLGLYLENINHYFPLFDPEHLRSRVRDLDDPTGAPDESVKACANAILAILGHWGLEFADAEDQISNAVASQAQENALESASRLILGESSLFTVQTLTMVAYIRHLRPTEESKTAAVLGAATRMAYDVALNMSHKLTEIVFADRLERFSIFWCLYILDVELALRTRQPPCIPDDEIDRMFIEPPKHPHQGFGLVHSTNGRELSMFSARQRLARIAGRMWKELWTATARMQPNSVREALSEQLHGDLTTWKTEWLDYGEASLAAASWPGSTLVHIAELQLTFFLALLRAHPGLISPAAAMSETPQSRSGYLSRVLIALLNPSRDTLHLAVVSDLYSGNSLSSLHIWKVECVVMAAALLLYSMKRQQSPDTRVTDHALIKANLDGLRRAADHLDRKYHQTLEACYQTLTECA